jgi:hypothetical protein
MTDNDSGSEWQLNKNGKLKMGVLVRFPGETEPFGKVVHVTESEALVKRFDTGKREPMSLKSEVEFQMPSGEAEAEATKKSKKGRTAEEAEPSKPTRPKKAKDSSDAKPVKPKREKPQKTESEEEEETDIESTNEEEEEIELRAKEKKTSKPATKKDLPTASTDWYTAEEMSAETGHNAQWIGKNRTEIFDSAMWRVNTEAEGRGRKPVVYSSDALEVLRNTPIPTRGGGRRKGSDDGGGDSKPVKPKTQKSARKVEQASLFTGGVDNNRATLRQRDAETPVSTRGRKKASASSDPASDALDAIEATIAAAERQADAHAARYESLIDRLRQQKSELEFLAAGIAG